MPGPIYPIWSMDVLPGDDIRVNVKAIIESLPMRAPMLGGGKATFAFYWCPWSNYYRFMDNNERSSTEDIINRKRHTIRVGYNSTTGAFTVDTAREVIGSFVTRAGTILDFLGVPPGFFSIITNLGNGTFKYEKATLPAEKLLSYIDIVRNYYVNNQENSILRLESNDQFGDYSPVLLSTLDQLFADVRAYQDGSDLTERLNSYIFYSRGNAAKAGAGLFLRTYKMDLLRGIMNSSVGSYKSVVNVENGKISMETIRFANKLQKEIDKIDITGGRFSEYMRSRWNVAPQNDMNRPIFLGSVASYIGNRDVVATATTSTDGSDAPGVDSNQHSSRLGQQTGFSVGTVDQKRTVHLRADQYGTLMCVFSYVPYVDYSQGFELNDLKTTFADIYSPSMAQLGFQDVNRLELSALPEFRTNDFNTGTSEINVPSMNVSVGKRVAWSEYMAGLNRNHGQFAYSQSLDYWVYNRMYTTENFISNGGYSTLIPYGPFDSTTYVKPVLWNQLFDDVSPRAENYRLQANFEVFAKRPIGKRLMPHL